ncbi:MAG TPA: O-antigen ligase family protein [Bacteroidota bacterium]|nr:O-antigen ligase family protein [Bacteroidota bacterium]
MENRSGILRSGIAGTITALTYVFLVSTFVSIAVNSLALGLMAILWVIQMILDRRLGIRATALDYAFLAYIAVEALSTIFSVDPGQSLLFSKRILLIGIVYFFAEHLRTLAEAKRETIILLGTGALVGLIGVVKLAVGGPGENTRLGIFQFYMTTSQLMTIALLMLLPFVIHRRTPAKIRIAAGVALVPVAIALYATVTRGAYLAAAAGIILIALVKNWKLLIPFALVVAGVILFAPPYVAGRLQSIVDVQHPENASRLQLWSTGLRIYADHPIVGVGDIDLGRLLRQYADPGYPGQWGHLHNVALQILVTLGALGAAAVLFLFARIVMVEWRIYKRLKDDWFSGSFALGALAVFAGIQVNGLTEWSFGNQAVVILLWITLGMTIALGRIAGEGAS